MSEYIGTATYDPADNKLRLHPFDYLEPATLARVKDAGFKWAPMQNLFVAPMWTPDREDLLTELCGEIGDEDTSLVDRAEQRADRFEDYSDKRLNEAEQTRAHVEQIAGNIPFGQPILIGHHSQRKAEKDAQKIEDGMRRAVKLWETSEYWTQRAKGAIRHAKYKELPAVRHRRIKGLTADLRRKQKTIAEAQSALKLWNNPDKEMTRERAMAISNYGHNFSFKFRLADYPREAPASQYEGDMSLWSALSGNVINAEQAKALAVRSFESQIAWATRWATHYENRIAYEGAMLDEVGGIKAEQFNLQPGGQVLVGGEWVTIIRVNKTDGFPVSVTTSARYVRVKGIEEIRDYKPPTEEAAEKVAAATKLAPLVNYPGEGFLHITKQEWKRRWTDGKGTETRAANETFSKHRQRYFYGNVNGKQWGTAFVFITDDKVKYPSGPEVTAAAEIRTADLPKGLDLPSLIEQTERQKASREAQEQRAAEAKPFESLKESLKTGVQVVAAPQLFPTPPEIAAQMVELADIQPGQRRLEPSAGTGNLITAMADISGPVVAVEVSPSLADSLKRRFDDGSVTVHCGDFLEQNGNLGKFDRVIMNPPFERAIDIQHIKHALNFLKPGGKLVALCANGPRQREALQPLASKWEDLPAGSFSSQGTSVNVAMLLIEKPDLALWGAASL